MDLVEAYTARIRRLDARLNAYVTVTEERALERARALEAELAAGRWRGPLHGIPIGLKDNIDTAGVRTTAGSAVYADRVPDEDAEVVTRLEAAGAIVLGKLNLHEFAYGGTSAFTLSGPVRNPWDVDRIPGRVVRRLRARRSRRGCARAPSAPTPGGRCAFRPRTAASSASRRPTGWRASAASSPSASLSTTVGPMCRSVADAALMLQAMAGYDPRGIASIEAEIPDYAGALRRPTSALRLGVPRAYLEDVDPQVLAAVERALGVLGDLTAGARDVELPALPEIRTVGVEAYAYHADLLEESRDLYDESTLARIEDGAEMSAADYAEARYQLALVRKAIAAVFDDVDVLVMPTLVELPVSIEAARATPREATAILIRNTAPFNGYGTPAISVPCGFSREGLPIGLQLCGPALGEVDVLALAHAYEQATNWHERTPPL